MHISSTATPLAAKRWQPSSFMWFSMLTHGGCGLVFLFAPEFWRWALGALALNHLALTGASMWPRSRLLGSNWTQLPAAAMQRGEIAITIDDGPDPEVTPQVLDMLDAAQAKATFFCIGTQVERYPELSREIVRRGHSIENHSQLHRHDFAFKGIGGFAKELQAAQATITRVTGQTPQFFRAPAGMRNPMLDITLQRMGLQLASWTRRGYDTRIGDAACIQAKLLRNLQAGDILLLHDANAARTNSGQAVILAVLPNLLAACTAQQLRCVTLQSALTA